MDNRYVLYIQSGKVIVIDPLYAHYAQSPPEDNVKPALQNEAYRSATGLRELVELESIALCGGRPQDDFDAIGYYEIADFSPGEYYFEITDVLDWYRRKLEQPRNHRVFSIDTGQFIVLDLDYLDAFLEHFSGRDAYLEDSSVDRLYEDEISRRMAGRERAFVQVQSRGGGMGTEFEGDGEYFFRDGAFRRC